MRNLVKLDETTNVFWFHSTNHKSNRKVRDVNNMLRFPSIEKNPSTTAFSYSRLPLHY